MKLLRLLLFALIIDQLSIINCNAQWVNRGLTTTEITGFANIGNNIFVGTDNFGTSGSVYLSTNNGATWSNVSAGIPSYLAAYAITTIGSKVIVGTSGQGPYVSTDNGSSWTKVDSGLPSFFLSTAFAQGGGYLYMAGDGNGVYRSADQGVSWTQVYNMEFDNQVNAIAVDGSYVYVATENDVEVSPDGGNTWHLSYIQTFDLLSAAVNNSKLYVGSYYGYPPNLSMSPDSGKTWIELDTGLPMNNTDVFGMAFAGTDIFLATNSGIYLSKDEGAHWVPSDSGLNGTPIITCMFINNGIVYAGADTPAVWQQPLADFHCFTGPTSLSVSICAGSSYPFNGKQLTKTGTYTDTLPSFQGCDSVVTLRLTVVPNDTTVLNESVCAGFTYYFFGANESQTGIYTHLLQNVTGCDSLVVLNLTVNSEPHSTISPPGPVAACKGSGVTLDAGAGFTNYFWNTNATTETINVSQPGTYYCIVFSNNCQSPSDTVTVTLSNLTASFTDAVSDDTVRFTSTSTGATTYAWNFGDNTSSNLQSPTHIYATGGSYKVILTTTNSSCTAADTQTVVTGCIAPVLTGNISGPLGVCVGVNTTYSMAPTINATSYTWLVPSYCTLLTGQGTDNITVRFLTGFHTGEIGVHATGCGGNSSERLVFVTNSASAPSSIVGPASAVCVGSTKTYSTPKIFGVTSYTWTVTGATLLSGQGTDSIQVEFPSNYTSATISVQTIGNCGSSTAKSVTVTSTPPVLTLTGSSTGYCKQATPVTLSVVPVPGATSYTWTVPNGITLDNGQGTRSITASIDSNTFTSGDVTVYATNGCGNGPVNTLLVSAAPAKPASILGPSLLTNGDTYTDSVKPVPFATSYTWTVPTGWVVTGPTNTNKLVFTPDSVSGNVTVTANNECGSSAVLSTHYSVLKDADIITSGTDALNDIKVFPNPFSDRFEVQFKATENLDIHIRVYTIEGQLFTEQIQQTVTGTNQFYIDMNMAAPGIYIISAIAGGETKVMRVLKQ